MENKNIEELKNEVKELINSINDEETLKELQIFMYVVETLIDKKNENPEYIKKYLKENKNIDLSYEEIKKAIDKYNEVKNTTNY